MWIQLVAVVAWLVLMGPAARIVDAQSDGITRDRPTKGVRAPLLIMSMTGHYWMVPAEIFLQHAASPDKQLAFVEGASHNLTTCTACEQYPGQYGDTVTVIFDHVSQWLHER